jgi:hypothetical protein
MMIVFLALALIPLIICEKLCFLPRLQLSMEGEVVDRVGGVLLLLPLAKSAHQGVIGVADLLVDE